MEKFIAISRSYLDKLNQKYLSHLEYISKKNKSKRMYLLTFRLHTKLFGLFWFWAALMVYFVRDIELIILFTKWINFKYICTIIIKINK